MLGSRTYGKGLVQSIFELEDGSAIAVTIARYQTPSHLNINKIGLKPDIEVKPSHPLQRTEVATAKDEQYDRAVKLLMAQLDSPS